MLYLISEVLFVVVATDIFVESSGLQKTVRVRRQQGVRLANRFQEFEARSILDCAVICNNEAFCVAANYGAVGGICEFHSSSTSLGLQDDWDVIETEDWFLLGAFEYVLVHTRMGWESAKESCESLDSYLTDITSDEEQLFLEELLKDESDVFWWIGASDPGHTGDWIFISGNPVDDVTNWDYGQPDNWDSSEYCVTVFRGSTWLDFPCDNPLPSVCKRQRFH